MATGEDVQKLRSSWIWLALLGIISLIGGILALANPFAATMAAVFLAGWTFLLFGVLQIVHAFSTKGWTGFLWSLLLGIITAAVGVSLLTNPTAGAISLTMLVAILFLVLGVVKLMYAFSLRPVSGWIFAALSGVISIVLGLMILSNFPYSAAAVLGILLAIELLSNGVFLLVVALGLRNA
ncbi:HdeD family acid-resistance protein [Mesorhizobium sp. CN2-181]|uniref:HdeD family acid-resistance protein n=1 Tax=Mesorhizobium yinganensis TaxID=3157707 RepID=UPI0032B76E25